MEVSRPGHHSSRAYFLLPSSSGPKWLDGRGNSTRCRCPSQNWTRLSVPSMKAGVKRYVISSAGDGSIHPLGKSPQTWILADSQSNPSAKAGAEHPQSGMRPPSSWPLPQDPTLDGQVDASISSKRTQTPGYWSTRFYKMQHIPKQSVSSRPQGPERISH